MTDFDFGKMRGQIDAALKPIEPGEAWQQKATQTREIGTSTARYLDSYRAQIAELGSAAVKLLDTTFPTLAIASNTEASEIIQQSHAKLDGLLHNSDSDIAQRGLAKIKAAEEASRDINNEIGAGAQLLAGRLKQKIAELDELMGSIATDGIWTTMLDGEGLSLLALGNDKLPVFRGVAEPLEGGVRDIRDYRNNL